MNKERTWDLSKLLEDSSFDGITQSIDLALTKARTRLVELRKIHDGIQADYLLKFLYDFEEDVKSLYTIACYSYCSYVSDTTAEGSQALIGAYSRCFNEGNEQLRSLDKILGNILREQPSIIDSPEIQEYRHILERANRKLPHILSQVEEEIIAEKDTNGISAISDLYTSWIDSQMIDVEIDGQKKSITPTQAFSLLQDEKRETRKAVSDAYFGSFARDKLLHGTTLRAVCSDHIKMTKRRKWPSYMTQSLINQDVDEATINSLLKTLETESSSYRKYIGLKAEYFGQEKLPGYDLRAPWFEKPIWNKDWTEVKASVIQAYHQFDDEIGDFVSGLFDNRQVDSEDRAGRSTTAYAFPIFEKKTSFVFVRYNDSLNDAYIVAHEFGHAVHSYFTDSNQRMLNTDYSSCLAETGSIFGELLFTEQLLKECKSDELRLEILAKVLDRFYQWVFHIGLYGLFERDVYEFILSGGYLDADCACEIWRTIREKIFGDSVDWTDHQDYDWVQWSQLFTPNYRFHNYNYSFAQLLVFALYEDYKKNTSDFIERFKILLSRGGSMSPREQIAELGYDITRPDFWKLGIQQAEIFLEELKKLL